jgi:hypothetical protein
MIPGAVYEQFSVEIWHLHGALLHTGLTYYPQWSLDGTMVASVTQENLQVADANSGATTEYALDFPPIGQRGLLWSPSSRYLLAYSYSTAGSLQGADTQAYVVDRESGNVTALVDERRGFRPTAWLP